MANHSEKHLINKENCIPNWSVTYRAAELKLQEGLIGKGKKNKIASRIPRLK